MATFTGNYISFDGTDKEAVELSVTLSSGTLSWSLKALKQTSGAERWNLYNITATIGGVVVRPTANLTWSQYTPGAVIYSGSIALSSVTISGGNVACSASFGVGSISTLSTASGSLAVANPTVSMSWSATNKYGTSVIAQRSTITLTATASSGSGGTITSYSFYQDNILLSTRTTNAFSFVAPAAGTHNYYVKATDSNGTIGQSATTSITITAYTAPSFVKISSIRWSSNASTGTASDEGTFARLLATFNASTVGSTALGVTCSVSVGSFTANLTSGTPAFTDSILSVDSTYQVVYKLWDSYIGQSGAITIVDSISIGGRGLDLAYDPSTTTYGAAFGTKATPGYLDSPLTLRLNNHDIVGLKSIQSANYKPNWQARQNTSGGVIAIKLNEAYFTTSMFVIPITYICNYQVGEIYLSGYDYGANHWLTPRAVIVKRTDSFTWNFNFGYSGLHQLWVYINTPSQYCNFNIHDILNGHNGTGRNMPLDAIEISYAVPSGTLQTTVTAS